MLIRSQNKEVLVAFEFLPDIEVSGGVISARRRIFHQSKSHKGTGYDSGILWRFGIHKICNSRSM